MKRFNRRYIERDSGILISTGFVIDTENYSKKSFDDSFKHAEELRNYYEKMGVEIKGGSDLSRLLKNLTDVWRKWVACDSKSITDDQIYSLLNFNRIVEPVLLLRRLHRTESILKNLLKGTLDFQKFEHSRGKDKFFEIELWSKLFKEGLNISLVDPPDIVISNKDCPIGIACKKIYKENHVQNIVSEAVKQLETFGGTGVIAFNLDDIVTNKPPVKFNSSREANDYFSEFNERFFARHERHILPKLKSQRIIGAISQISSFCEVDREKRVFNITRYGIWVIPNVSYENNQRINEIYELLMN